AARWVPRRRGGAAPAVAPAPPSGPAGRVAHALSQLAEVGLADALAPQELRRRTRHHDLTRPEDIAPVGDRQGHRRVLLDDEDGHPGAVDLLHQLEVLLDELRG